MYRVLCYGDSNTWGFNPVSGLRFSPKERWPGVLSEQLGSGFNICEDGRNGRTLCGCKEEFIESIDHNDPVDVVILFLGINDIVFDPEVRVDRMMDELDFIADHLDPNRPERSGMHSDLVLISAVPPAADQVSDGLYELEAGKVEDYRRRLRSFASSRGFGFIDSAMIVSASGLDGLHLDESEHHKLGLFVADYLRSYLKNGSLKGGA